MRNKDETITVPAMLLQDLLWNIGLNTAGVEPESACERSIIEQANKLQSYLTPEDYIDPLEGFTFDDLNNVEFVDFKKRA